MTAAAIHAWLEPFVGPRFGIDVGEPNWCQQVGFSQRNRYSIVPPCASVAVTCSKLERWASRLDTALARLTAADIRDNCELCAASVVVVEAKERPEVVELNDPTSCSTGSAAQKSTNSWRDVKFEELLPFSRTHVKQSRVIA